MRLALMPQSGVAMIVVLLAIGLLSATALGLALSSSIVRLTGANHDEAVMLANASEAALELAAREFALIGNWDDVLLGVQTSTMVDGVPGPRDVAHGISIDLVALTNQASCGRQQMCTDAQVRAATQERPWGDNNPRWRLFIHRPLPTRPPPIVLPPAYIVVWLGDDAAEIDSDPLADGAGPHQPGRYIVRARAEAFGPRGGRHAIEAEFARVCQQEGVAERCAPGIRVQSWRTVDRSMP